MTQGSVLWFYIFPLVISAIAICYYRRKSTGLMLLVVLLFFSMFRGDNVGNDTSKYMDLYGISKSAESIEWGVNTSGFDVAEDLGKDLELASSLLNYLVLKTHGSPRIIIYVYSILTIVFLYLALKRLGLRTSIGLMFYVLISLYFFSLTAARQMAAVSIVLYGITFLVKDGDKRYMFLIYLVLGALFHISAIFYFWLFSIPYIRINSINRNIILAIMIAVILFVCFSNLDIESFIYRTFNMEYIQRYEGLYTVNNRSLMGRIFDFLKFSFFAYIFLYRGKIKKSSSADISDIIFAIAIVLMALFSHISILISRITYYVTVFICIYMATLFTEKKSLEKSEVGILLLLYIALVEPQFGGWADSLTSGYYLMF